jgi:prepilin-type N-terminal cleavage/methylation domain-containing protein
MEPLRLHRGVPREINHARISRGVTLLELLVVLTIISILSIIVVLSQRTFNRSILLHYTAYDVALTIRSAQTYGLGSRSEPNQSRNVGYGVHFSSATPTSFLLFADAYTDSASQVMACHPVRIDAPADAPDAVPGDCVYQAGSGRDPQVAPYTLGNGMKIKYLYTYAAGNRDAPVATLDIVFARPNTETYVSAGSGAVANYGGLHKACVELESPQGGSASIQIQSTGQISVTSAECPTTL